MRFPMGEGNRAINELDLAKITEQTSKLSTPVNFVSSSNKENVFLPHSGFPALGCITSPRWVPFSSLSACLLRTLQPRALC